MNAPPDTKPPCANRRRPHGRAAAGVASASVVVVGLAWAGCTVTADNYRMLSLFFDGVPDPNAPSSVVQGNQLAEAIRQSPTYSVHKPFADDACAECHASRFTLSRNDSPLCLKCHSNELSAHPRMHGPVAAGVCLWCHLPHESPQAHLLRDRDRPLCLQCHQAGLLSSARVAAHADPDRGCLECHFGHGGDLPSLLRSDNPTTAMEPPQH